ncbi:MGMT family protein [Halomarina oriensis]|uniref:Methylated-DNA--[protein]-cysteine S-methyltransferase n=1 Tax=Halomarina oriensis TaxID=671145 RepID=A0A6B0GP02_9EURY|nr:MGMT family protein [Halomarina oriensis]MWG35249.1 methylated-DNA--[protein]-cysteine S-methyltransferase [Halomarina oriensis]
MDDVAGIYAREAPYLDRYVQVGVASDKVISLSFPTDPEADADPDLALLDDIEAYLEGERETFEDVELGLTVPTDQREVLLAVREISYGSQVSVQHLARAIPTLDPDDEDDHETIRAALADNPIPLLVPDHRVRDGPSGAPPEVEQRLRTLEEL